MGIERARVVEVHAETSPAGCVGSGYLLGDGLALTCARNAGRQGPTVVRPAGTGPWLPATVVWTSRDAEIALLEVDDEWAALVPSRGVRWGGVAGKGAIGVTASGYPPAPGRPQRFRDPVQFYGRLIPGDPVTPAASHAVTPGAGAPAGDGLSGAALFAGAHLLGVLLVDGADDRLPLRAVPVQALIEDDGFVDLVAPADGLRLGPVQAPSLALPILQMP